MCVKQTRKSLATARTLQQEQNNLKERVNTYTSILTSLIAYKHKSYHRMTSNVTDNDVKLRKDIHHFWEKVSQLYHAEEKPTYSKNRKLYNFAVAILSPSKPENKHILCPQQGKDVLKDLKQYAGFKKYDVLTRLYQFKGWEYKARQQAKLSEAPTPSKVKTNVEDDELDELRLRMETLDVTMELAVADNNFEKVEALNVEKAEIEKAQARREKQVEKEFVSKRKKELKSDIKKLKKVIPTQSSKEQAESIALWKAKDAELKKLSQTKREKKMSVNQVAQVMNDALTEAKQDEPEYEELINEELDEFLRTKNSTNDFSVSIAIDKKGNLFCDYDSVNNTMGKKFGTFNRATGKWKLYKSYLKILGTNPEATQAELIKSLTEQHSDEEDGDEDDEEDDKENKPKYEEFDNKELENYFEEKGYRYDLIIDKSGNLYEYNSEFDDSENEGSFEAFGTFDRITGKWEIDEDYEFIISDV